MHVNVISRQLQWVVSLNTKISCLLKTSKSEPMAPPELNYIAIMFEFNAESMGQVNCYVPTHNESCFLRTKTSQNTGGGPQKKEMYKMK